MRDAGALQLLAIQVGGFERIACALDGDVEGSAVGEVERILGQQGEVQQVVVGAGVGIEAHHVECQP